MQPAATNLNSEEFNALLEKLNACKSAREWAKGKDLVTAWSTCHRGDWLLWLLHKAAPLDTITNELLVCRFAREVVHLNDDPRVLACIKVREAWARGEATNAERAAAWDAARAATWTAASSAARSAAWSAAAAAARSAARSAAEADAYTIAEADPYNIVLGAAEVTALKIARAKQAYIIRELVPMPALA